MNVLGFIQSNYWLMDQSDFDRMCLIAARNSEAIEKILNRELTNPKPESLLTKPVARLQGTRYVSIRENVAIIDVNGVIAKRMNMFEEICEGGTSTEMLAKDFQTALDNPNVNGIVFNIHSPGGEAFGMQEIANLIYSSRGKKPIKSYVSGMGASAAYFIAAAADEVIISTDSMLGSVGVVSEWQDASEFYKKLGIDRKVVTSKNAPNKRLDLNTEDGMRQFQATLDAMEKPFIQAIARFRGKTFDEVVEDFNQGGVLIGKDAVKAGLADRTGNLEQVISALQKGSKTNLSAQKSNTPKANTTGEKKMNLVEKFQAWLASDEVKPLLETETNAPAATAPVAGALAAENEKLRAELQAEKDRNADIAAQNEAKYLADVQAKAEAFYMAELEAGRITPAEKDYFLNVYEQVLADDISKPLAGASRAARFEAAQKARPADLFGQEILAPGAASRILKPEANGESGEVSEERKKELLGQTPLGKSALKAVK